MDMMEARFRMMAMMGGSNVGAEVIKGSFTVPSSGNFSFTFGKSLSKYFYLIEATDETKQAIKNTGSSHQIGYAFYGIYPQINYSDSISFKNNAFTTARIKPTDNSIQNILISVVATDTSVNISIADISNITGNTNALFRGYTYNYTVISLENI